MSPTEQKLLDTQREMLAVAGRFTCCACSIVRSKGELGDFHIWRPTSKMMRRAAGSNSATYVLCEECERKPESETRPAVEANLARKGLFG